MLSYLDELTGANERLFVTECQPLLARSWTSDLTLLHPSVLPP